MPSNHVQVTLIHRSRQNIHIPKRASAPSIWTGEEMKLWLQRRTHSNKMLLGECRTRTYLQPGLTSRLPLIVCHIPWSWIARKLIRSAMESHSSSLQPMNTWKLTLVLTHIGGLLTSRAINIKSGIFQADSLQPLPFCMALVPLIPFPQENGCEIQGKRINHVFFITNRGRK